MALRIVACLVPLQKIKLSLTRHSLGKEMTVIVISIPNIQKTRFSPLGPFRSWSLSMLFERRAGVPVAYALRHHTPQRTSSLFNRYNNKPSFCTVETWTGSSKNPGSRDRSSVCNSSKRRTIKTQGQFEAKDARYLNTLHPVSRDLGLQQVGGSTCEQQRPLPWSACWSDSGLLPWTPWRQDQACLVCKSLRYSRRAVCVYWIRPNPWQRARLSVDWTYTGIYVCCV